MANEQLSPPTQNIKWRRNEQKTSPTNLVYSFPVLVCHSWPMQTHHLQIHQLQTQPGQDMTIQAHTKNKLWKYTSNAQRTCPKDTQRTFGHTQAHTQKNQYAHITNNMCTSQKCNLTNKHDRQHLYLYIHTYTLYIYTHAHSMSLNLQYYPHIPGAM